MNVALVKFALRDGAELLRCNVRLLFCSCVCESEADIDNDLF